MAIPTSTTTQKAKLGGWADTTFEIEVRSSKPAKKLVVADPDEMPGQSKWIAYTSRGNVNDFLGSCVSGGRQAGEIPLYDLEFGPGDIITVIGCGGLATTAGVTLVQ